MVFNPDLSIDKPVHSIKDGGLAALRDGSLVKENIIPNDKNAPIILPLILPIFLFLKNKYPAPAPIPNIDNVFTFLLFASGFSQISTQ